MLPEIVQQSIEVARTRMLQDPHHSLILKHRLEIYENINKAAGSNAIKTRAWLALLTAELVLPIFGNPDSAYLLPSNLVKEAKDILLGKSAKRELREIEALTAGGFYIDTEIYSDEAGYAAEAALLALAEAHEFVYYKQFDTLELQQIIEKQIAQGYPDEVFRGLFVDAASMAVCAYSGISFDWDALSEMAVSENGLSAEEWVFHANTTFAPNFQPAKRREFWEWWLSCAIPQAWQLAQA